MEFNRKNMRALMRLIAFAVLLLVSLLHLGSVLQFLQTLLSLFSFLLVGLSLAFIMNTLLRPLEDRVFAPLNRRLGKRWQKICRPPCILLTVLLLTGLVLTVVFMVLPEIGRTLAQLGEQLPAFVDDTVLWLNQTAEKYGRSLDALQELDIDWDKIRDEISSLLRNGASSLLTGTFTAATSLVSGVFNAVIGMVLALYVLANKERLCAQARRVTYAFMPEKRADAVVRVARLANQTFNGFICGQFTEAVILGLLCFIGMLVFGFPFAPMISVLVGFTALIPLFGAFIGVSVGAFLILVNQGFLQALWFVLFFLLLQQLEGNLIYPHVVGKSVMLPGMWVLIAVTLGGNLNGVLGMLVSVPICSVLYALFREAVNRRNRENGVDAAKLSVRRAAGWDGPDSAG